jgi:hypothetical protein
MRRSKVFTIRITELTDEAEVEMLESVTDRLNDAFDDLQAEIEEMIDTEQFEVEVAGREEFLPDA